MSLRNVNLIIAKAFNNNSDTTTVPNDSFLKWCSSEYICTAPSITQERDVHYIKNNITRATYLLTAQH